jgi:hypothetical protein
MVRRAGSRRPSDMHHRIFSDLNCLLYLYFITIVTAGKIVILFFIGPSIWPDTGAYISFADAILTHGEAFRPMDWAGGTATPPLIFRLAGYPLILVAAKILSPSYYAIITVVFQISLSILVITLIIKLCHHLSF